MARDTRSFIRFMPQTVPINLENRIADALTNSQSELWFPHLTDDLTSLGWKQLYKETGITESNYGTARVILKDTNASRNIAYTLKIPNRKGEIKDEISVELLPIDIAEQYEESGVNFYAAEKFSEQNLIANEVLDCVKDAFNIIRQVPSLFTTILNLVKSIHLIKPESDEYDVSFSEPHIPFSIFVSIPGKNSLINALRVAEAIVHEAMHLQLTILESIVPLVINSDEKFYSPWKNEHRTSQGVLHALYVFRVIKDFFYKFSCNSNLNTNLSNYIQTRCEEIENQISQIESFESCPELTEFGRTIVERLFDKQIVT